MYPTSGKSQKGDISRISAGTRTLLLASHPGCRAASREHACRWTNDCEPRRRETHCHILNALQPHRATLALVPLSFCSSALRLYAQHISSHSAASQYDAVGWGGFQHSQVTTTRWITSSTRRCSEYRFKDDHVHTIGHSFKPLPAKLLPNND